MHRMTFQRCPAAQRGVVPGAALAVSALALFVALSGVGVASGVVGQPRTQTGGVIARTFLVMRQGTNEGQQLYGGGVRISIGQFRQRQPNSIIEVIWTGHVSDRSSWGGVCRFQLQLDVGAAPDGDGGKAIVGPTSDDGVPVGITAFFSGSNEVAPGRHSLSVVVQSTGGSDYDCYMDPGNFRESFVVEEWSPTPR
jgi:hypothetical protein